MKSPFNGLDNKTHTKSHTLKMIKTPKALYFGGSFGGDGEIRTLDIESTHGLKRLKNR